MDGSYSKRSDQFACISPVTSHYFLSPKQLDGVGVCCTDLKVTSDLSHFSPCLAYLFLLRLVFTTGPNLSGTPHRGRFIALARSKIEISPLLSLIILPLWRTRFDTDLK